MSPKTHQLRQQIRAQEDELRSLIELLDMLAEMACLRKMDELVEWGLEYSSLRLEPKSSDSFAGIIRLAFGEQVES